ncbi:MAG TPA: LON peptidase substrate-binding domain-containing protein, partial [Casimicrobiaceae bacterium]
MTETEHPQATAEAAAPERTPALPDIPSDALVLLPTRNLVLFPGLVTPLNVGRASSLAAVQEAARSNRRIGVVLQKDPGIDAPAISDLHEVGTAASVLRYLTTPDGTHHVVAQGQQRFRIVKLLDGWPFLVARVELAHESEPMTPEIEARMIEVKKRAAEVLELIPQAPAELTAAVQDIALP